MTSAISNNYSTLSSLSSNYTSRTKSDNNFIVDENGNLYEVVSKEEHGVLGQDDFLQMLMVQMQYQDPMNPMDTSEYMSQLTSFSMLEQLTQISTKIDDLAKAIIENKTDNSNNSSSNNSSNESNADNSETNTID